MLIEPQLSRARSWRSSARARPRARSPTSRAPIGLARRSDDGVEGADAVVVATMGHGDEELLAAALASGAGYVGLVASAKRRGARVLAELRDPRARRGVASLRVRAPAGLDLGPSTQEEIAVAILAELVAWRHTRGEAPARPAPAEAVDPVCGMTVAVGHGYRADRPRGGDRTTSAPPHCRRGSRKSPTRYHEVRAT